MGGWAAIFPRLERLSTRRGARGAEPDNRASERYEVRALASGGEVDNRP
jgi:hypothetical protein